MFLAILRFELKYWLKHIAFYVYAALFFLFALFTMAGAAGLFGEGSSGLEVANSPFRIFTFAMFFGKLLLLLVPAIVGETIFRDYKSNIHSILYAYPITKRAYLPAKFLSGAGIVLLIAGTMLLGLFCGACLPGTDTAKTVPPDPGAYSRIAIAMWRDGHPPQERSLPSSRSCAASARSSARRCSAVDVTNGMTCSGKP